MFRWCFALCSHSCCPRWCFALCSHSSCPSWCFRRTCACWNRMDEANPSTDGCWRNITTVPTTIHFSSDIPMLTLEKCTVSQANSIPRWVKKFLCHVPIIYETLSKYATDHGLLPWWWRTISGEVIAIGGLRKEWVGIGKIKEGEGSGGGGWV